MLNSLQTQKPGTSFQIAVFVEFFDEFFSFVNFIDPLSANITKWLNTLKQFVDKLPTNCLSVFDHFVGLALKGLTDCIYVPIYSKKCVSSFMVRYLMTL